MNLLQKLRTGFHLKKGIRFYVSGPEREFAAFLKTTRADRSYVEVMISQHIISQEMAAAIQRKKNLNAGGVYIGRSYAYAPKVRAAKNTRKIRFNFHAKYEGREFSSKSLSDLIDKVCDFKQRADKLESMAPGNYTFEQKKAFRMTWGQSRTSVSANKLMSYFEDA